MSLYFSGSPKLSTVQAIPRQLHRNDWITLLFIGVLLLLVFLRRKYPGKFYNFRQILRSPKYFTENNKTLHGADFFEFVLFIVQMLLFSLGLYFVLLGLGFQQKASLVLYVKILLIYSVFIGCKYYFEKIIGVLFSIETFLNHYLFHKTAYKNFLALYLFPVVVILNYLWGGSALFFKIGITLFIVANILANNVFYKKQNQFISQNLFYFILYLCTFEIAPYYILYKVVF